ncbi:hypothetical protein F5B22DRAFT_656069 [Xylaria bambusicola]|uniref:uncharacterized protein n=1 Tax=Xylaria bambusicola TaxID=326684 RepID=UPI0020072846|nr:uncharacterized protein F5B22DRAFT_656069 [Xylaria bambusicola]KAI0515381.1 hypothetical protein F5B22DRAFT_656069 [Xylaria bambusicola]
MHGKKHPAKNSNPQSWGPWSDWKWDHIQQRWYAERFDYQGNVECQYDNDAPTAGDRDSTPRTEGEIDQLTAGLGDLNVNSGYDQGIGYADQGGLSVSSSIPDIPTSPQYIHDSSYHDRHGYSHSHSHRDKGKGISNAASHDSHYDGYDDYDDGQSQSGSVHPAASSYSQQNYSEHIGSAFESEDHGMPNTPLFSSGSAGGTSSSYYSHSSDHDDYELQQALKNSRDELLGNNRPGGPSTSGGQYDPGTIYPGTYELSPNFDVGDGETTPRGTPVPSRTDYVDTSVIRGTPGNVEPVDHRFVVEHSYKFQPGEVFKILWSEPTGQVAGDATISDIRAIHDARGDFYVGFRRFIIVSTDESHHSTCVPILTYDRRGCGKKGVRPSKHGIIYAVGQKPKLLRNEPELGFDPVPLEIYADGETLARESRVNYSKLVTIEHNVKVFFIGRIPYHYFESVSHAVDKCWSDKMHKSSKRTRR